MDIGDALERELAGWDAAFDRLVERLEPDVTVAACDGCGDVTTVLALARAVTRDPEAPVLCRCCTIVGGMAVRAARPKAR